MLWYPIRDGSTSIEELAETVSRIEGGGQEEYVEMFRRFLDDHMAGQMEKP